jgi:hypothetical protein
MKLMTVNNVKSDKYNINYKNFEKIILNRLFPYFNIIKNPNKNILHLQYKKVDNFQKFENIQNFISSNFMLSKAELIKKIVSEYTLSQDEAESEYEKWASQNELEVSKVGDKNFQIKPRNDNFVNVKLRLTSTIDLSFLVSGVKSSIVHERIVRLLEVLMVMSTEKVNVKEVSIDKLDNFLFGSKGKGNSIKITDIDTTVFKDDTLLGLDTYDDIDNDYEDLFEDDEDLKALELDFLKEQAQTITHDDDKKKVKKGKYANANANAEDNDETSVMKSYFMDLLKGADKDLFDYKVPKDQKVSKRYSTICQWVDRRQPVVVNEEELQKIQKLNKNIKYVKTGSTQELESKNFYICPQIWCPKSKVALTYDDYKNKYNEACPYPDIDETPILLESKSFWGEGEKGLTRDHYPGFLDPYKHPQKFCLPCCFKMEAKEGSKNKHKENTCNNQWNKNENEDDEQETFGNEKYIKAEHFVPLEASRYGLLPKAFNELLENKACGNGLDGKGLMTDKTNCILRKGINQKSQSFITALISVLDNPKLTTPSSIIEKLKTDIDVVNFTSLEHGKIMKLFINREFDIYNKVNFQQFVKWFVDDKQEYVIKFFNLQSIKRELQELKGDFIFNKNTLTKHKEVVREFLIYNAYKHFLDYMSNPLIEKHYNVLIDYVATEHKWLNTKHYNIVVIEHDPTEGKIHMICPFSRNAKNIFDMTDPFVFLFKQNNYYEPLSYVKVVNGDLTSTTKFVYKTAPPSIKTLINFYMDNCSTNNSDKNDLIIFLKSIGLEPSLYVIDYSYRVCGIIAKGLGLYIPFNEKSDLYELKGAKFIYFDEVITIHSRIDEDALKGIYKKLYQFTNDDYYIIKIVKSKDNKRVSGVITGNHEFVPIDFNRHEDTEYLAQLFIDDLNIFIEEKDVDKRETLILSDKKQMILFNLFSNEVHDYLEKHKDIANEFRFIMDPQNPFPKVYKRRKLKHIMTKTTASVLKKGLINENDIMRFSGKLIENMLSDLYTNEHNIFMKQMFGMKKKFNKMTSEVLFDHKDVIEGRLVEKISMLENPYISLMKRLDEYMKDYITEFKEFDDMEHMRAFISKHSNYEDVPYKFRKYLHKHSLLIYPQYNINTMYELFIRLFRMTQTKNVTHIETLRSVVLKNIIRDFQNNELDTFYENPSYAFNAKVMKLKTKSTNNVYEIFESMNYYPSFYELVILSKLAKVNVILIGRKRKENEEGIDIIDNNASKYIMMAHGYNRFLYYDLFQLIVRDPTSANPKFLYRKHEISPVFIKLLSSKKITL